MNVLYFTLDDFESLEYYHSINADLLREFTRHDHKVYVVSPIEKRKGKKTYIIHEDKAVFLKVRIGNIQKTNIIEKGISTVTIESVLIGAIRKYFSDVKFDLILYCTPPITFYKAVEYVKKRDGARTYLLLKDIFPQNAVDMGMLSKNGLEAPLYWYFRAKEKQLYRISDHIGCMSESNVDYLLKHNPEISRDKVDVCPNSVEPIDLSILTEEREQIRKKYNIPLDKTVFIYGGNLGKPQGISFMLKCLHSQRKNDKVFFLIIGNGTEYVRIERYIEKYKPENIRLHQWLPKEDYDKVVAACDVGMIFLDDRFTIPNFPSRLLGYMQTNLPVLAATDTATDIGKVIVRNGFGWWCESDNVNNFKSCIMDILRMEESAIRKLGRQAYRHLINNYSVKKNYKIIMDSLYEKIMDMKIKPFLKEQLLCKNKKYMLTYDRGCLFIRNANDKTIIQRKRIHRGIKSVKIVERIFRYEPRAAIFTDDDTFIFSDHGYIYAYMISSNTIIVQHKFAKRMNNPLTFCTRIGENGVLQDVVYGEYIWNKEKGPVAIYKKYGSRWEEVYAFPSNTITHIHNIVYDKYKNRYLITTGDEDSESGIWQADLGFHDVKLIVKGSQQYRACILWPTANGIYYVTDTPLENNWIYRLSENSLGISTEKVCEIPGPCIYGCIKSNKLFIATSVEGNPELGKWRYRLSNQLGKGVKDRFVHIICMEENGSTMEVCEFKKDYLPMWLFQFGNAKFPYTEGDEVYICPQSTIGKHGTYVVEV